MGTLATRINNPVIPIFPSIYYCDPGDVQRRLSIEAVKLHTEDYGEESISGEYSAIEDAIWDATEIINYYCFAIYQPADLAKSSWINRRAVDIAVYSLFMRRGNNPPAAMEKRYKECIQWLELVHESHYEIPGVPVRHTLAPAWSNVHIDQRYPVFRVRVERNISDKSPAPYNQTIDWQAEYDYSILIILGLGTWLFSLVSGLLPFGLT